MRALTKEEVDILVEEWHTLDDETYVDLGQPGLAEWLGWTTEEYNRWRQHGTLPKE